MDGRERPPATVAKHDGDDEVRGDVADEHDDEVGSGSDSAKPKKATDNNAVTEGTQDGDRSGGGTGSSGGGGDGTVVGSGSGTGSEVGHQSGGDPVTAVKSKQSSKPKIKSRAFGKCFGIHESKPTNLMIPFDGC